MNRNFSDKAEITLLEGNIVKISIIDFTHIDEKDVKQILASKDCLIREQQHTVLLTAGEYSTISIDALKLCAAQTVNRKGKAIVTRTFAQKIVGHFFIKTEVSGTPVKLFDYEEDALIWLRQLSGSPSSPSGS